MNWEKQKTRFAYLNFDELQHVDDDLLRLARQRDVRKVSVHKAAEQLGHLLF